MKAVIFDMDGTLLDSERLSKKAWNSAARAFGKNIDTPLFMKMVGKRTPDISKILAENFGGSVPAEKIAATAAEKYAELVEAGVPVMPGAFEILEFCRSRNLKTGVATSTRRAYAQKKLERAGLFRFIDAMTCGDEVECGKPAPEIYEKTARALGCAPEECLAVEDSPTGFRSAFNAGCKTVLIPDIVPPTPEVLRDARLIFKNLNQLKDRLEQNL